MLAGAGRLDGRVEGQQVGLAGDALDHQGDPLDVLAALVQRLDRLAAGAHPLAEPMHALDGRGQQHLAFVAAGARPGGGVHGLARQIGGGALGVDHHFGAADDLFGGVELGLQLLRQALHRERHAGGRQGVLAGVMGQVASQPGDVGLADGRHRRAVAGKQPGQPEQRHAERQGQVQRQPAMPGADQQENQGQALQQADEEDAGTSGLHE
ncbi:hypothetical protein PAERUG_P54_1_London_24_VIM_2_04_13_05429 [Pseudomonas aeruginosa]|nr:hypothetical protein PAERUG_P54_1_London_24_VIM_2_04_13_05429 [Pseudomonas aeruginosa]